MTSKKALPLKKCLLRIIRSLLWGILWLIALAIFSLYPLRWLTGDMFYPIRMFNYIQIWLLILLVPMFLVAVLTRRKGLALLLAFPMLLIGLTYGPYFWPQSSPAQADQDFKLKLISYNVFYREEILDEVQQLLKQQNPDILLLQESHPTFTAVRLGELAPDYYVDVVTEAEANFSSAVVSRYPLTRLEASYDKGRVQKVQIETPAGSIQLWNVHPLPPYFREPDRQDQQLARLAQDLTPVTEPLIVAGDFNITHQSANYRLLSPPLHEAHQEVGWGLGFTFPAPPHKKGLPFTPGLLYRIDHIFYNEAFIAHESQVLNTSGISDHRPIMAVLSLKPR